MVELIIVIAILVVLAALLLPLVSGYLRQSTDAACAANRRTVRTEVSAAVAAFLSGVSGAADENTAISNAMQNLNGVQSGGGYADICPQSDGVYTVSVSAEGSVLVNCSVHGGDEISLNLPAAGYQQGLSGLKGMVDTIKRDYFEANSLGTNTWLESTEPNAYTSTVNAMLTDLGYDPEKSYWRVSKQADGISVYWSEAPLSQKQPGDRVAVYRVKENSKNIYQGTGTVAERTASNGTKYKYFTTIGGFSSTGERTD